MPNFAPSISPLVTLQYLEIFRSFFDDFSTITDCLTFKFKGRRFYIAETKNRLRLFRSSVSERCWHSVYGHFDVHTGVNNRCYNSFINHVIKPIFCWVLE